MHPDSKVPGANMGPIWGRQDPGGPHIGPMNFAIWADMNKDRSCVNYFRRSRKLTGKYPSFLLYMTHLSVPKEEMIMV